MTPQLAQRDDLLFHLRTVQREHYMTQADLAREIGVSESTISQMFNNKLKGDEEKILARVRTWLEPIVDPTSILDVVHTTTFDELIEYFQQAYNQHVIYAVTGRSGFGKSTAGKFYGRIRISAYYITGRANMGAKHLLAEIAKAANIIGSMSNSVYEIQNKILQHFATRSALLIIDEADKLNVKTLDAIREIFDLGTIGLILMGEDSLELKLRTRDRNGLSLDRLYNRIDQFHSIQSISAENVRLFLKTYGFPQVSSREAFDYLVHQINRMGGYRRLKKVVDMLRVLARTTEGDTRTITRDMLVAALSKFPE